MPQKLGGTIKSAERTGVDADTLKVVVHFPGPPPETVVYPDPSGAPVISDVYLDMLADNVGKTADVTTANDTVVGVKVS